MNAPMRLPRAFAVRFESERLKYKKDEYDKFNPNEILKINVKKSTDKMVLVSEIKANFQLNDFKKVRKFCKKYFKHYGLLNKYIIYYILSFIGEKSINIVRKIIFN